MAVRDSTVKVTAINFFMEFPFGGCRNGVSPFCYKAVSFCFN